MPKAAQASERAIVVDAIGVGVPHEPRPTARVLDNLRIVVAYVFF